jgi:hypothetical protein
MPSVPSTVGLYEERLVLTRRHQHRFGGDSVLKRNDGLLAFLRLGFRRYITIFPRKSSKRCGEDGEATNELAVIRAKAVESTDLRGRVDLGRIDVLDSVNLGGGHLEALADNQVSQVLSLSAEEATLAHFASQTGSNETFENEVETVKHLLKRGLFSSLEGIAVASRENPDVVQVGHANIPSEAFENGIHDATHVGRSGLNTERKVVELVLAAMSDKGRLALVPFTNR